jgi:hypothetical protein
VNIVARALAAEAHAEACRLRCRIRALEAEKESLEEALTEALAERRTTIWLGRDRAVFYTTERRERSESTHRQS